MNTPNPTPTLTVTRVNTDTYYDLPADEKPLTDVKVKARLAEPFRANENSFSPGVEVTNVEVSVYVDPATGERDDLSTPYVSYSGYDLTAKGTRDKRQARPQHVSLRGDAADIDTAIVNAIAASDRVPAWIAAALRP